MAKSRFQTLGPWVVIGTLGCNESPSLNSWQGSHIIYESDNTLQPCGGTYAWVDNYVPFVARELGLDVPPMLRYQWLQEDDLPCRDGVLGCSDEDLAWAQAPFLLHELVHSTMYASGYPYQPFFGEGLAYALDPWTGTDSLGPRYLLHWKGTERLVDPRPSMTLDTTDLSYITAGSFVMFLLARHGPAPFLKFVRALGESRDMTIIRQTFAASYGIALDDEAELFMTGAACTPDSFGPGLYDCTAEEVPWEGERWSLKGVMDCSSDGVVGGGGGNSVRSVRLDVPKKGNYLIQASGDGEMHLLLGPCSSCPWERRDRGGPMPFGDLVELDAGTYFVRIQGRSSENTNFEISVLGPTS